MTTIPGEPDQQTDEPGVDPSGEPETGQPDPESNAVPAWEPDDPEAAPLR